jgi:hypothetical protein
VIATHRIDRDAGPLQLSGRAGATQQLNVHA